MKSNKLITCLLVGVVSSVGALADMRVEKSTGALVVTSTINGTVIAKVVGPDDQVLVDTKYEGNSFTWTPSGVDGAYRYDVRVIPVIHKKERSSNEIQEMQRNSSLKSDYAGGSVEVVDGQIAVDTEEQNNKEE